MKLKSKLTIGITLLAVVLGAGMIFQSYQSPAVGAATQLVAGQTFFLAGSGISSTATSFTLTSFTIPQNSYAILDGDVSETFYVTLEPGSRQRQEIVSCTTVVQNAGGTATLSGCTRGLSPITPYLEDATLKFAHSGGSSAILSNPPQIFEEFGAKGNDEIITGSWTVPTPTASGGIASKSYVDGVVNGGDVTLDGIALGATAGETFATGTIVFFDLIQKEWMKADASVTASSTGVQLGISQGAGLNGIAINGGVLTRGYDSTQTGMTVGQERFLSDTAGETSASAGTIAIKLGIARTETTFYFDPIYGNVAYLASNNTFTGITTFSGEVTGASKTEVVTFTSSGTWSKDSGLARVRVQAWGGGGSGASRASGDLATAGGGGGYFEVWFEASELGATETVTVGTGGASVSGNSNGNNGGDTSFGSLLIALQGYAGLNSASSAVGGNGGDMSTASTLFRGLGGQTAPLNPTDGIFWGGAGGGGGGGSTGQNGANAQFGGAGGGSIDLNAGGNKTGGTSLFGGNGGASVVDGDAVAGSTPAGGGGGSITGASGAGGTGKVIVTEFYN